MYCFKCGNKLMDNAAFCIQCGSKIDIPGYNTDQINTTTESEILNQNEPLKSDSDNIKTENIVSLATEVLAESNNEQKKICLDKDLVDSQNNPMESRVAINNNETNAESVSLNQIKPDDVIGKEYTFERSVFFKIQSKQKMLFTEDSLVKEKFTKKAINYNDISDVTVIDHISINNMMMFVLCLLLLIISVIGAFLYSTGPIPIVITLLSTVSWIPGLKMTSIIITYGNKKTTINMDSMDSDKEPFLDTMKKALILYGDGSVSPYYSSNKFTKRDKISLVTGGILGIAVTIGLINLITYEDDNDKIDTSKSRSYNQQAAEKIEDSEEDSKISEDHAEIQPLTDKQEKDPSEHKLYDSAVQLMNSGNYESALKSFNIISDDGYNVDNEIAICIEKYGKFLYEQADGYFQTGKYEEALALFEILTGYEDSDERAEICRSIIGSDLINISPDCAMYYLGESYDSLIENLGEPDQNPRFHPISAAVGGYNSNSYKYGSVVYSYINISPSADSRIICIEAGNGSKVADGINVGMTFKELSDFFDFNCGSPVEMQIEPVSSAGSTLVINGYECEMYFNFPLGADINTPSEKFVIYSKALSEEVYNNQNNDPHIQNGSVKAYMRGTVTLSDNGSILNLRSGPGTNYDVLAKLKNGELVFANSDANNGWYYVETEYGNGYVSADYVTF